MSRIKRMILILLAMITLLGAAYAETVGGFVDVLDFELEDDPYINDVLVVEPGDEADSIGGLIPVETDPDVFTLLLIGVDGYANQISGRSDSIMVVRLNKVTGKIKICSFMRDLYVKIPGKGKTRINAAFVYGRAELLAKTLYANFDISADAYVAVNFKIMKELIDEIGGVDISITKAEMNQINKWMKDYYQKAKLKANYQKMTQYGQVHLDGDQALAFSRIRAIDSDYERTRRQRAVVEAIFKRVMEMGKLELVGLVMNNIGKVDTDMTLDDALHLAPIVLSVDSWEVETFRIPAQNAYTSQTISGMAVLVPNLEKSKKLLEAFFSD